MHGQYPDCSLADLYDKLTMPPELRKAHQQNDIAVMTAYGIKMTESECGRTYDVSEIDFWKITEKVYILYKSIH